MLRGSWLLWLGGPLLKGSQGGRINSLILIGEDHVLREVLEGLGKGIGGNGG